MSLYNLSASVAPSTLKISDFLAKSFDEDFGDENSDENEEIKSEDLTDINQNESSNKANSDDEKMKFVGFLEFNNIADKDENSVDVATSNELILDNFSDDIENDINNAYIDNAYIDNALSIDVLPKFDIPDEKFDVEEVDVQESDGISKEDIEEFQRKKIEFENMVSEKEKEIADAIKKAEESAKDIKNLAKIEADKIKDEAYEEGRMEGQKKGYDEGLLLSDEKIATAVDEKILEFKSEIAKLIDDIKYSKQKILNDYIENLKDIALITAEKIVKVSLKSSADIIKNMILSATADLQKTQWIKIYVSKYDFDMINEADYDLVDHLSELSDNVKIIVMENEPQGTAIIETKEQVLDLSVDAQLKNIKEVVNNTL